MTQRPDFFDLNDIALMARVAQKPYDPKSDSDIASGNEIKDGLWNKTIYWHNEVLKRLDGFSGQRPRHWQQRSWMSDASGRKVRTTVFKPYTWTRIYKTKNADKDIFFTVGVDGVRKVLVYKLDYKNIPGPHLTPAQRTICEEHIKKSPAGWVEIKEQQLAEYTWERLINETVAFIQRYASLYDQVVHEVYANVQTRLARMTFNTEGWCMPSGPYGKSKDKSSHEVRNGFGHEEWLCDTDKQVDGYHYAFLEPIYKFADKGTYEDRIFNLRLYTIHGETKDRDWVGLIRNAEVLTPAKAEQIWDYYKAQGWLDQMREDIEAIGGNPDGLPQRDNAIQLFNIRFRPEDLTQYDLSSPIPRDNPVYESSRYVLMNPKPGYETPDTEQDTDSFNFDDQPATPAKHGAPSSGCKYERKPKIVESHALHEQICRNLHKYLAETKKLGYDHVKREVPAGYEGKRIDMVVKTPHREFIFYEVKTYPVLQYSIREAIGQILEYTHWPDQDKAAKLIILTQPHKNYSKAAKYMATLRKKLGIQIYYQYFDPISMQLSEEI